MERLQVDKLASISDVIPFFVCSNGGALSVLLYCKTVEKLGHGGAQGHYVYSAELLS
jgi:hypothetical protein